MKTALKLAACGLALAVAGGQVGAADPVLQTVGVESCENCESGSSGFSDYSGDAYYATNAVRVGFIGNYMARARAASPYHMDRFTYDASYGYIGDTGHGLGVRHNEARIYNNQWVQGVAQSTPWHGGYAYINYGRPTALVVPPTAALQTKWAWGVGNTVSVPIYHQFGRAYPGAYPVEGGVGYNGMPFQATPLWPSSTDQFGVYYVRGPW
ncbi:MAG TPA: hypothetical protein VGN57_08365 [Pirellulaceae bacterium]|jgi:hypothetical protein|nr:hypothetical protein [Pirellulaceae bacterium]